jgi:hypothetical protein
MKDIEYVKSYKEKELRHYVVAYLLIAIASVGFNAESLNSDAIAFASLLQMVIVDILVGAACVLVVVLNELWSDKVKNKLVYGELPSNTVFTDIANNTIDATGFDVDIAKTIFADKAFVAAAKQTAEWDVLLRKCKDAGRGNVIESERLQLMTRDICMGTVSLLIMTIAVVIILAVWKCSILFAVKMLWVPTLYLIIMLVITRVAAINRARRFVAMVIKNAVQDSIEGGTSK